MSFLDLFTPKTVRIGGFALAAASLLGLHGGNRIGYASALAVAAVSWAFPKLWNWLSNFADPHYWPTFVALGVASMFAAHQGGYAAVLALAGPLTMFDGMYFDTNY